MNEEKERFSGRDLAEAIAAARKHFGVSRQEIGFEIVQQGKIGPFEESAPLVEILAWVREAPPRESPQPGRRFERRGRREDVRGRGPGRGRGEGRGYGEAARSGGGRGHWEDSGERGRPPRREVEPVELAPLLPSADITDAKAVVQHLADALVSGLDLGLRVEGVDENEVGVRVLLDGEDVPLLLESDGEGLDAMQYIANRILQKDGRLKVRVSFDAGGHRAAVEARLTAEARRVAEEVCSTGQVRKMRPLGPYERRLVHLALAGVEGIRTFSTGAGYRRRLHIAPAGSPGPDEGEGDDDQV